MALTVELKITRPNTETNWPWSATDASTLAELASLRETHGATSSNHASADGLSLVYTESCPLENGDAYFAEYANIWQGVAESAVSSNITITSTVIDNT